jgi:hypothetical protein
LDALKRALGAASAPERAAMLAMGRRWTEAEEKWGYDKSWEWFGDTALHAASREGESACVRYLLEQGADPTLESMVREDTSETPAKSARLRPSSIWADSDLPNVVQAKLALRRSAECETVRALLAAAGAFWKRCNYSSPHYSVTRKNATNRPSDAEGLCAALLAVPPPAEPPAEEVALMVAKLEAAERERGQKQAKQEREAAVRAAALKERLEELEANNRAAANAQLWVSVRVNPNSNAQPLPGAVPPMRRPPPPNGSPPGGAGGSKKRARASASGGFCCPDCGKTFTKGSGNGETALANHSKAKGHGVYSKKTRTM